MSFVLNIWLVFSTPSSMSMRFLFPFSMGRRNWGGFYWYYQLHMQFGKKALQLLFLLSVIDLYYVYIVNEWGINGSHFMFTRTGKVQYNVLFFFYKWDAIEYQATCEQIWGCSPLLLAQYGWGGIFSSSLPSLSYGGVFQNILHQLQLYINQYASAFKKVIWSQHALDPVYIRSILISLPVLKQEH